MPVVWVQRVAIVFLTHVTLVHPCTSRRGPQRMKINPSDHEDYAVVGRT